MSTPPLLIAAGMLFWGWQSRFLLCAVPMALVFEGARLVRRRWDVAGIAFERISDLCTLFFVGTVIYSYATRPGTLAIMNVIQWLPLCLFPILAAQAYSAQGKVDLGAFFWTLRRRAREGAPPIAVDMSYGYLTACVFAASAANVRAPGFYLGLAGLSGWALWRSSRNALWWFLLLPLSAVLGYAGHVSLHEFQNVVELRAAELVFGKARVRMSPYQSDTAIGRIGALKRSDRIVLRVTTPRGQPVPRLLKEAGFDRYKDSKWLARDAPFSNLAPGDMEASWKLSEAPKESASVRISAGLPDGQGMLALPAGSFRIDGLPAGTVSRTRLGAVKAEGAPGFAEYAVAYSGEAALDGPPTAADLSVPESEKPLFARIAAELGLKGLPAGRVIKKVSAYFQDGFSYSTYQDAKKVGPRPLEDFLLRNKSGHCEYYATATALVLRAAGVPARYATGYSVQEYGKFEKAFLVRQKHAHAWVLAYVDGSWWNFDTTPPSWVEAEDADMSLGRPLRDFLSWCAYRFSRWRWGKSEGLPWRYIIPFLLALTALIVWRLSVRLKLARALEEGAAPPLGKGLDSEFFEIEKALTKQGLGRRPWEPANTWLRRISSPETRPIVEPLGPLLELHNRYRFDPNGLSLEEREALRTGVLEWLSKRRVR